MSVSPDARSGNAAIVSTPPERTIGRRPTPEERRLLVAASLRVGNPDNKARDLPSQADPKFDCQIELAVDEIKPYEHNPRRAGNAKFGEIKESIRVSGIRNPITVTRRPGEAHFIVEAGGNTRLLATQQLWMETRDPRYQKINVMFRPWRSESHVLIAHLVENEQRGELTFWDRASGVMALKAELGAEKCCTLSLRELEQALKQLGMPISRSSLSLFQFATEKLGALGEAQMVLAGSDIKRIQPRVNLMKRYAEKGAGIDEADLYARVLNPVFEQHARRYGQNRMFDAVALCHDCEAALAEHLGEPVTDIRMRLDALEKSPDPPLENLDPKPNPHAAAATATDSSLPATPPAAALSVHRVDSSDPPGAEIAPRRSPGPSGASPGSSANPNETHERSPDIESESRRESAPANAREVFRQRVILFARLTGVAECLHFTAATISGYYMEAPQSPLELDPDPSLRRRAWWLLALLCGQKREDVSRRLPDTSAWRRLRLREGDDEPAMPLLLENELAGPVILDEMLTDWLTDPADEAATLFCEILTGVRTLRAASQSGFSPCADVERPAGSE